MKPETLDEFRDLCKKQGLQYTKVLERLAQMYLYTGGKVLQEPSGSTSEASEDAVTTGDLEELKNDLSQVCNGLQRTVEMEVKGMSDVVSSLRIRIEELEKNNGKKSKN